MSMKPKLRTPNQSYTRQKLTVYQSSNLFDTSAGMSIMSSRFFRSIINKPKVFRCNRQIRSVGGDTLMLMGECFIDLKIGNKRLKDRAIIIKKPK